MSQSTEHGESTRGFQDAAHEMRSFLKLAMEIQAPGSEYPDVIWGAMRTACAVHIRNLLEFFHEGSPGPVGSI